MSDLRMVYNKNNINKNNHNNINKNNHNKSYYNKNYYNNQNNNFEQHHSEQQMPPHVTKSLDGEEGMLLYKQRLKQLNNLDKECFQVPPNRTISSNIPLLFGECNLNNNKNNNNNNNKNNNDTKPYFFFRRRLCTLGAKDCQKKFDMFGNSLSASPRPASALHGNRNVVCASEDTIEDLRSCEEYEDDVFNDHSKHLDKLLPTQSSYGNNRSYSFSCHSSSQNRSTPSSQNYAQIPADAKVDKRPSNVRKVIEDESKASQKAAEDRGVADASENNVKKLLMKCAIFKLVKKTTIRFACSHNQQQTQHSSQQQKQQQAQKTAAPKTITSKTTTATTKSTLKTSTKVASTKSCALTNKTTVATKHHNNFKNIFFRSSTLQNKHTSKQPQQTTTSDKQHQRHHKHNKAATLPAKKTLIAEFDTESGLTTTEALKLLPPNYVDMIFSKEPPPPVPSNFETSCK